MEAIEFLGFGLNAWITIVTVFTMFAVLLFTKWRSDMVFQYRYLCHEECSTFLRLRQRA